MSANKMFPYSIPIFIFFIFFLAVASGNSVICGKHDVCDELGALRTEVDVNTADRMKWNRHFQFIQRFHRSWEEEVTAVAQKVIKDLSSPADSKFSNVLFNDNRQLRNEMAVLERKLEAMEVTTTALRSEVEEERKIRSKIQDEVVESLLANREFIQTNYTEHLKEMQSILGGLFEKVVTLENQDLHAGNEIEQLRESVTILKSSLRRFQVATLEATSMLQAVVPSDVVNGMVRELRIKLDSSEDLEREHFNPIPFLNKTTNSLESKIITEMGSKIEEMESKMKTLTDTIEKTMSSMKVLENKYNAAMRAQSRPERRKRPGPNFEFVSPHSKNGSNRPFDPRKDP